MWLWKVWNRHRINMKRWGGDSQFCRSGRTSIIWKSMTMRGNWISMHESSNRSQGIKKGKCDSWNRCRSSWINQKVGLSYSDRLMSNKLKLSNKNYLQVKDQNMKKLNRRVDWLIQMFQKWRRRIGNSNIKGKKR